MLKRIISTCALLCVGSFFVSLHSASRADQGGQKLRLPFLQGRRKLVVSSGIVRRKNKSTGSGSGQSKKKRLRRRHDSSTCRDGDRLAREAALRSSRIISGQKRQHRNSLHLPPMSESVTGVHPPRGKTFPPRTPTGQPQAYYEENESQWWKANVEEAKLRSQTRNSGTDFHSDPVAQRQEEIRYKKQQERELFVVFEGLNSLESAMQKGHVDRVVQMLQKKSVQKVLDPNYRGQCYLIHPVQIKTSFADSNGKTTYLHRAVEMMLPALVGYILSHGADANAVNSHGITPLCQAILFYQQLPTGEDRYTAMTIIRMLRENYASFDVEFTHPGTRKKVNLATYIVEQLPRLGRYLIRRGWI